MQHVDLERLIHNAIRKELEPFDKRKKYDLYKLFFTIQSRICSNYPQIDHLQIRHSLMIELLYNHKRMLSDKDFSKLCALVKKNNDKIHTDRMEAMYYDMGYNEVVHAPY